MSACEHMRELISRMIDGDLNDEEKALLAEHLASCPDCARLYDAFAGLSTAIGEDLAEPPEALHEQIMDQIRQGRRKSSFLSRIPKPYRGLLATAACLALIAGFSYGVEYLFPLTASDGSDAAGAAPRAYKSAQAADTAPAEAPQAASMDIGGGAPIADTPTEAAPIPLPSETVENAKKESYGDKEEGAAPISLSPEEGQALEELLDGMPAALDYTDLSEHLRWVFSVDEEEFWAVYVLNGRVYYGYSRQSTIFQAACTPEQMETFAAGKA